VAVTDVVEEFLIALADRGYEPLLAKTSGALAIHLVGGPHPDRWVMAVDKGNVTVAREGLAADATITLDRSLFERMVQGRANAMAAVLRGAAKIDGDLDLLLAIQRVFPGPNDGGADQGESRP
jgi:putative sterol carrier protein